MLESLKDFEKDRKTSLFDLNKPIKIPRTFVFDQNIPENQYHLYIDPEEYYNEEFDVCRNEFQNYRTSLQKKQIKTLNNFQPKKPKNIRLCLTTQNAHRRSWGNLKATPLSDGKTQPLFEKNQFFEKELESSSMKKTKIQNDSFDKKLDYHKKKSEIIEKFEKKLSQKKLKLLETLEVIDIEKSEISPTLNKKSEIPEIVSLISSNFQDPLKIVSKEEEQPQYKWNKKEVEMSMEIRDNDKTQIIIEKTKRAIRRNELKCTKLKRRVNDENFGTDFKQNNKTSIRKSNLALESVFSEGELADLLNNDELQAEKDKITAFQGGYISRYIDNNTAPNKKKGKNFGYSSKIIEKNYQPIVEKPKKMKKSLVKINVNSIYKEKFNEKQKVIENKADNLFEEAKLMGVFPEQVNKFRINAIKYVNIRKAEKHLQRKILYEEIIKKLRNKSPKSTIYVKHNKNITETNLATSPKKKSLTLSHGHGTFLTEDEKKMLSYIKDVLTKPMSEGNNVEIDQRREVHEGRLLALKRNIVKSEKLDFFSLDKRVQNIKYENLHIL